MNVDCKEIQNEKAKTFPQKFLRQDVSCEIRELANIEVKYLKLCPLVFCLFKGEIK